MSTVESSCTVVAASQMPCLSVLLETIPVVPGGHLRPEVALGLTVSRRTVLGGTHTSVWVNNGQMSLGRSLAASVKCGPDASMAKCCSLMKSIPRMALCLASPRRTYIGCLICLPWKFMEQ